MLKQITELVVKRYASKKFKSSQVHLSTLPKVNSTERLHSFRTNESNPMKHDSNHLAQFYRIPDDEKKHIFTHGGIPKSYEIQAKTFTETCLLVRQPALDIITNLRKTDFDKPVRRYLLYGKKGSGKTLSMAHVLHYAHKAGFVLVHVPWVGNWMRRSKESSNTEGKEGFIDLNIDAAAWLLHFKAQNSHLLQKPEFVTSEQHVWSKREVTEKGESLVSLVEHGINRIKYASKCVVVLSNEIKMLANSGICKTLVAIDGYNAFFYPNTRIFTEKKERVHPHKIVLTEAFLNLSKFDWKNGAVVLTVDELAIAAEDHKSHLPRYLLGKDGFEHIDPFVPVPVDAYSAKEFTSSMDYFRERKWVNPYPNQDEELASLSASNPYRLMQLCAPL